MRWLPTWTVTVSSFNPFPPVTSRSSKWTPLATKHGFSRAMRPSRTPVAATRLHRVNSSKSLRTNKAAPSSSTATPALNESMRFSAPFAGQSWKLRLLCDLCLQSRTLDSQPCASVVPAESSRKEPPRCFPRAAPCWSWNGGSSTSNLSELIMSAFSRNTESGSKQ